MKKIALFFSLLCLLALAGAALAARAPVYQDPPPESLPTPAEGDLAAYDLSFPPDMPLAARNFVLTARAQFERHPFEKLPKANEYTQWYYEDKREIGWCSVFQIWCAYHSGVPMIHFKQKDPLPEGAVFTAMEGRVGNVYKAFVNQNRWRSGEEGGIPKPGYLIIYGVRGSTPYTHIAIVESAAPLADGRYELTTIEGNVNSTIKRMNFRYDPAPKKPYYNMSVIPENEITRQGCQYTLQKDSWYVTGFCATW